MLERGASHEGAIHDGADLIRQNHFGKAGASFERFAADLRDTFGNGNGTGQGIRSADDLGRNKPPVHLLQGAEKPSRECPEERVLEADSYG
jgi:hypothetical protein